MMHDDQQQSRDLTQLIDRSAPNSSSVEDISRSERLRYKKLIHMDPTIGATLPHDSAKHKHHHVLLTPCEVELIEELREGDVFGTLSPIDYDGRRAVDSPLHTLLHILVLQVYVFSLPHNEPHNEWIYVPDPDPDPNFSPS